MSQPADLVTPGVVTPNPATGEPAGGLGTVGASGTPDLPAGDSLARVLADLETVLDLPLEERAAMFERMHDVITDALSRTVDGGNGGGASSPSVAAGGGTR